MKFKGITPNLSVKNIKETVAFYQLILGFEIKMVVLEDTHTVEDYIVDTHEYDYALVYRDELHIMFTKENTFRENVHELEKQPLGASTLFYIEVENIDKFYTYLLQSSVNVVKELTTTWYGMREFFIKDCNGYVLAFGEQV